MIAGAQIPDCGTVGALTDRLLHSSLGHPDPSDRFSSSCPDARRGVTPATDNPWAVFARQASTLPQSNGVLDPAKAADAPHKKWRRFGKRRHRSSHYVN
jgi:hypothetical protein